MKPASLEKDQDLVHEEQKKRRGKRYFFNRMAMFCNHIAVAALLICYLAPYVSPGNFWFLAFFGLAYPLLVIINLFFALYWFAQFRLRGGYSLLVILGGWFLLQRFVQLNLSSATGLSDKAIKVMSYNVKSFDLYNWSHNKETRSKVFDLIEDEAPDIACFQEFFHRDSSEFSNADSLQKLLKWPYAHVEYTNTVKRIHHWGLATFSKYPILRTGKIDFEDNKNNICIFSDILLGTDTFRVYNMHLQSIAFSKEDYKYAEGLQTEANASEDIERSKNILRRLKRAFIKRSDQADEIAASIAASPYKVIVCGDFNDTPSSYTYATISKNLKDCFMESGSGFGKTYTGAFPSFRIDYIFCSPDLRSHEFRTIKEDLSDHYPVVTYLEVVE